MLSGFLFILHFYSRFCVVLFDTSVVCSTMFVHCILACVCVSVVVSIVLLLNNNRNEIRQ